MARSHQPSSRSMRRRSPRVLGAGVAAVSLMVLAACGPPPTTTGTGAGRTGAGGSVDPELCPIDALAAHEGTVEIDMWFGGLVDPPVSVLQSMVDDFNASQDKVKLTANNQGNAYIETLRKYEGASATPAQLPDLIYLEDTTLGQMIDKKQLLPAEACMIADGYDLDQITAAARAAYTVDDVFYPGYMNVSAPILYINKAHFQEAGLDVENPPTTLAEIAEAAKVLKDAGISPKPFSFKADQWFFNQWMAGVGQKVVDNDNGRAEPPTEAIYDDAPAQEILSDLDAMNREGLLNPFPVTDGSIDHYLALISEESSMLIETSTASGTIAAALGGDLTAEDAAGVVDPGILEGVSLVPGSGEYPGLDQDGQIYASGGAFFLLNTGSDVEQAASWEFTKFMLQPENALRWYLEGGYLPVVKEAINDPAVKEFSETELDGQLLQPAVDQLAAADPDRVGPIIGPFRPFQLILQGALEGVLFNNADPAKALADAEAETTELLQDYNG